MHNARTCAGLLGAALLLSSVAARAQPKEQAAKDEKPTPATEPGKDIEIDDHHQEQKRTEEPGAPSPARQEMEPASEPPKKEDESDPDEKKFTLSGYVETFYQYNFNNPGNGISNYRGYDTRHNTLTLANAVLDAGFRAKNLLARLALQFGHTPATYYAQEPSLGGTDGAGETDAKLWRHLQRASVGWQATKSLLFEGGLFLTNIGVESLVVKDNWHWSRTNASVRLPNYSSGVKATWHATDRLDVSTGVFNGWNSIVDNNDEKSVLVQAQYKVKESLSTSAAYFGGIEREGGAVEGRAWRHAFDVYAQVSATKWLELAAEGSGGWEANRFGTQWFTGASGYVRFKTLEWLYVALRGDRLWEDPSANARGTARPILIPAKYITSATATLDARPIKGLSLRLEGRHDIAARDLFFKGNVAGDGSEAAPYVPNARVQTTLLAGAVAWF
ncbi:MAG TPA: outer membrane beta-barrel protein [Labilithrix sp.]|nr:outer membrane beta-barrel protein [Labilithrix sp.]